MNIFYTLTLILGLQLLTFHILALAFYLYWAVWWFDIIMHILGGVWLLFIIKSLQQFGWYKVEWFALKPIFILAMGVFFIWEVFGVVISGGFKSDWLLDTSLDTLSGIVGVLLGYWLVERLKYLA